MPRCGALRTHAAPSQPAKSSGFRKRERSPGRSGATPGRGGPDPGLGGAAPPRLGLRGRPPGHPPAALGMGTERDGGRPVPPALTRPRSAPLRRCVGPPLGGAGRGGAGRGRGREPGGAPTPTPRPGSRRTPPSRVGPRARAPRAARLRQGGGGGMGSPEGGRRRAPKGEHKSRVRSGTAFPEDAASRVPRLGSQRTLDAWKRSRDRLQLRAERPGGPFPGFTTQPKEVDSPLKWL